MSPAGGAPAIAAALFAGLVCVTLLITVRARRHARGATGFYAAGRAFSGRQNGLALAGDFLSAGSFLGIAGLIALSGHDGFLYSVGSLAGWLPVLLLAGPLRNVGRFTLTDVAAYRVCRPAPVRVAGAVSTVTVSVCYLVAQMVGAGALVSMLLGIRPGATFLGLPAPAARVLTIAVVGALMILYVVLGGMRGTTWVQIVKTTLLLATGVALAVLVLARFRSHTGDLLAVGAGGTAGSGDTLTGRLDFVSAGLALALGTAGLPHVVGRLFTVPDARAARTSVSWAIGLVGGFFALTLVLGLGAAALVGRARIVAQDPSGNTAVPQLARALGDHLGGRLGGDLLLAFVAAVAGATILAVVAGLMMAAATSLAHDLFGRVLMLGRPRERQELAVARIAAVLIGAAAVALAVFAQDLNVAFLVGLAFAVAASAHVPVLVLSLCWRRFTGTGAVAGVYGGLVTAVVLVVCSPVVSGRVDPATGANLSLLPKGVDFAWFPLDNPALVSVPAGLLCAIAGTLLSREKADPARYTELSTRALTGVGAS